MLLKPPSPLEFLITFLGVGILELHILHTAAEEAWVQGQFYLQNRHHKVLCEDVDLEMLLRNVRFQCKEGGFLEMRQLPGCKLYLKL